MRHPSAIVLLLLVTSFATSSGQTPINYKVAFVGDTDFGPDFQQVLDLMARENVDAVVHAGDLAYSSLGIGEFMGRIENTLGPDFPYFASVGNHDIAYWPTYQAHLEPLAAANGITWDGDYGTQSSHEFQGIHYVMVAPGDVAGDHAAYVRDQHAASNAMWKVTVMHRNMRIYQLDNKFDATGWGVYEESRKAGAFLSTGHAHCYGRTFELADFENAVVSHFDDSLTNPIALLPDYIGTGSLDEGRSFVFVSGLGGRSIRTQGQCAGGWGPGAESPCDVWGAAYTLDQSATWGALIGQFNYGGDESLARFTFMNVDDEIVDEFYARSGLIPTSIPNAPGALVASAANRQVDLTWVDLSDNENAFAIERSTDGGTLFEEVAQVAANLTSYTDAGLPASTEYCYRVRADNFAGASGYTNLDCATTPAPVPPAAPIDLTATASVSSRIDVTWTDQADDEDGFMVERSTDGGVTFDAFALTGPDAASYSDVGVPPMTQYCYRVRAFNAAGGLPSPSTECAVTPDVLVGPAEFQELASGGSTGAAAVTSGSISAVAGDLYLAAISAKMDQVVTSVTGLGLTWTPVTDQCGARGQTGVAVWSAQGTPTGSGAVSATLDAAAENAVMVVSRYTNVSPFQPMGNVLSANTLGMNGTCLGGVDGISYSLDITAALDSALVYSVAAHRNPGHTPGPGYTERMEIHQGTLGAQAGASVQERTVGTASTVPVDGSFDGPVDWAVVAIEIKPGGAGSIGPPAAPTGLLASAVSTHRIDVGWTGSGNEDGFRVERSNDGGSKFIEIAQVGGGVVSYSDTNLLSATEYRYRVRAYSSGGNSGHSNVGGATTLAPLPPPIGPEYLVASAVSPRQVDLSWTGRSTNEDGFKVERSADGGSTYIQIGEVGVDVTAYSDTGLLASTPYCYRVRAFHSDAHSVYSNYACATTPAPTPPAEPTNLAAVVAAAG
ncbi:fibronectin type III domain-containing protein, partial [bacterium]|nr:fibronectin type III domain-containing protein [bacterium]